MITLDEFIKTLPKHLCDEIDDSNNYYCMAVEAKECGNMRMADCLFEISKDEYTHAKFIHDVLISKGMPIPDDVACKWKAIHERAMHIYPSVPTHMYDI